LAPFSLFGFDLMSRDELLVLLGPSGSGSEQLLVARIGASVKVALSLVEVAYFVRGDRLRFASSRI
jgi:hypothetical protein